MRFLHLGDLHIGKRVNEFPMLDDQRYILDQIVRQAVAADVDTVVIAGDVYDKAVPVVEALQVFERFLLDLVDAGIPACVIAGNHDSAERLSFGSLLMEHEGIHIARAFSAQAQRVRLDDGAGPVDFHLLPYVKPSYVRAAWPDEEVETYEDAVRIAIAHMEIDLSARNVLVAHQFVTSQGRQPATCESETVVIGGVDNVDASLFDAFDYVALGHLHGRQSIGRPEVRYCGSPLKYSFSEARQNKTLSLVDMDATGVVTVTEVPLAPLRDLREVKGSFAELREHAAREGVAVQDYLHVTLTDDHLMDAMAKVREFYPNVMRLDFAATTVAATGGSTVAARAERTLPELFDDFFVMQTGTPLSEDQRSYIESMALKQTGDDAESQVDAGHMGSDAGDAEEGGAR